MTSPLPPHLRIYKEAILLILEYINYGNGDFLHSIKHRSRAWCEQYHSTIFFRPCTPQPVVQEHPHLFQVHEQSLARLDKKPHTLYLDDPLSIQNDKGNVHFPSYTEPLLLDSDDELWWLLDAVDNDITCPVGMQAKDLMYSPILFYLPAVLGKISSLDLTRPVRKYAASNSSSLANSVNISPITSPGDYELDLDQKDSKSRRFGWAAVSSWAHSKFKSSHRKRRRPSIELDDGMW